MSILFCFFITHEKKNPNITANNQRHVQGRERGGTNIITYFHLKNHNQKFILFYIVRIEKNEYGCLRNDL